MSENVHPIRDRLGQNFNTLSPPISDAFVNKKIILFITQMIQL